MLERKRERCRRELRGRARSKRKREDVVETGARIGLIETAGSYVPCEHVGDLDVDQVGDKTGNASALDCLDPIAGLVAPVEDRPQEGTRVENGLSGNLVPPEGCPPAEVRRAGG